MYLDANAHLPLNPRALQAYVDFYKTPAAHGHPSSPSLPGRLAAAILEDARARIAKSIGAQKASQIIFTSTCTEACAWGLQILSSIDRYNKYTLYSSQLEHPAVRDAFENENVIHDEKYIPVDKNGVIVLDRLDLTNAKVVCIHVQNEIGTIQPIEQIKCRWLFSDLSQSLGKIPINVSEMNVDIAAFASHKVGGTSGFGFLFIRDPQWWEGFGTGSRYFMDRPGTPDVAGAVACAVALEESIRTLPERTTRMQEFQLVLEAGLEKRGFEIIGNGAKRIPGTTFTSLPGKAFSVLLSLSEQGIYVGLGSACGSMHTGPSKLLSCMNRTDDAHDVMRISQTGEYTGVDAEYFLTVLDKIL